MFDGNTVALYAFLIGRVLYGGILAFMSKSHFTDLGSMAAYARSKGVPMPKASILISGLLLLFGGLSILTGAYTFIGCLGLLLFFIVVTPTMHDFWHMEDPQQYKAQQVNFLKNLALTGGILVFMAISNEVWPVAFNL